MKLERKHILGLNTVLFAVPMVGLSVAITPANAATLAGALAVGTVEDAEAPTLVKLKAEASGDATVVDGAVAGVALAVAGAIVDHDIDGGSLAAGIVGGGRQSIFRKVKQYRQSNWQFFGRKK